MLAVSMFNIKISTIDMLNISINMEAKSSPHSTYNHQNQHAEHKKSAYQSQNQHAKYQNEHEKHQHQGIFDQQRCGS